MGGDGLGPDFGAILTPQFEHCRCVDGSGAGKVVDVLHDGGGGLGP